MTAAASSDPLSFDCPRCATTVQARFYGPCDACRSDLRRSLGGDSRDLEVEDYEPKMNVVPNQVAMKD